MSPSPARTSPGSTSSDARSASKPGDVFRAATARADLVRLENLGIFSSQAVTAAGRDSTVALTYQVREMPWIVPYPKVKYTELDGFSFGIGVASVNLFGRAMYLSGYGTLGGVDVFSAVFRYPLDHRQPPLRRRRPVRLPALRPVERFSRAQPRDHAVGRPLDRRHGTGGRDRLLVPDELGPRRRHPLAGPPRRVPACGNPGRLRHPRFLAEPRARVEQRAAGSCGTTGPSSTSPGNGR